MKPTRPDAVRFIVPGQWAEVLGPLPRNQR
jgi:hypothetical protein